MNDISSHLKLAIMDPMAMSGLESYIRSLDKHLASCGFTLLPCPNKCQKADKMVKVLRKDLERHSKECQRRLYKCHHCQEVGEYIRGENNDTLGRMSSDRGTMSKTWLHFIFSKM